MSRSRSTLGLTAFTLALSLLAVGCRSRALAELEASQGNVSRDFSGAVGSWEPAAVGAAFSFGDGLRTDKASSARLRVGPGRVQVESDTTIRLLKPGSTAGAVPAGVEVSRGRAIIEALETPWPIRTRGGGATLRPGTRIEVVPAADGERYRVLFGAASFTEAGGATIEVAAGRSISIGIGRALLEPEEPPAAAANEPAAVSGALALDAAPSPQDAGAGELLADPAPSGDREAAPPDAPSGGRSGSAELIVAAGESFRVYDPHPPTQVGFSIDACAAEVEVAVARIGKFRGHGLVTVPVGPGSFAYKLRCLGRTSRRPPGSLAGSVRVVRADGTRPLPKSAPHNTVELDGRKYTLMYQNLRPALTVVWPEAPAAASYTVVLALPNGANRTLSAREPSLAVPPGVLLDGAHSVSMHVTGSPSLRAKATTLNVSFDNAAPAASLESPSPLGFESGASVHVQGVAVAGSRVSIDGHPIELDRNQRFSVDYPLPANKRALAVRFQDPARGTSYYLRRPRTGLQ